MRGALLAGLIGVVAGCAKPASTGDPGAGPRPSQPARPLDRAAFDQLYAAFKDNQVAAKRTYADARWQVVGTVDDVRGGFVRGEGRASIRLEYPEVKDAAGKVTSPYLSFDVDVSLSENECAKLSRGKKYTFVVSVGGFDTDVFDFNRKGIEFTDARLVE